MLTASGRHAIVGRARLAVVAAQLAAAAAGALAAYIAGCTSVSVIASANFDGCIAAGAGGFDLVAHVDGARVAIIAVHVELTAVCFFHTFANAAVAGGVVRAASARVAGHCVEAVLANARQAVATIAGAYIFVIAADRTAADASAQFAQVAKRAAVVVAATGAFKDGAVVDAAFCWSTTVDST